MGRGDFLKLSSLFFEHGLPRPQNTDKTPRCSGITSGVVRTGNIFIVGT
jgi:hypothetical protein